MAYTSQKAIDHARTGRFNAAATATLDLARYGQDFALLIGQYPYAKALAKVAYDELIARHNNLGNPKYNKPLGPVEIAAVTVIASHLGIRSPFAKASNWYGRMLNVSITDQVIDPIYKEISEIYDADQTMSLRNSAEVLEQVHRFMYSKYGQQATPAQEKAAAVLVLVFTLAVEIMLGKLTKSPVTSKAISMGPDASIVAQFSYAGFNCLFMFSDYLNKLSVDELTAMVSSDPADAIINGDYRGRVMRLCIGTYTNYVTSFKQAFAALKQY